MSSFLEDIRPRASLTLAALNEAPNIGLEVAASLGCRGVQISAGQPGTRPQDLGGSARRDLIAAARRHELVLSGVDAWARADDLIDPTRVGAALEAIFSAITLASDLGRLSVSLRIPELPPESEVVAAIAEAAARLGVVVLDHGVPIVKREDGINVGIDPPVWLAAGCDPVDGVREAAERLGSVRVADLTPDGVRDAVGGSESKFDLHEYLITARVVGFDGLWVIDARQFNDVEFGIRRTLRLLAHH